MSLNSIKSYFLIVLFQVYDTVVFIPNSLIGLMIIISQSRINVSLSCSDVIDVLKT